MDDLAMDGGPRSITLDAKALLKWPKLGKEEEDAVLKLLRAGEISKSSIVDDFTKEFKEFVGTKYAIAKTNGTACLLASYFALNIGKGDEVIAPTNTYWATVMPAAFLGAKIVFCESDPITQCIDPEDIRKKVTDKTKAIVPVHLYGYPCDMDPIMEIAQKNDIAVIEDASHAHGAEYKGKRIGTIGDVAAFSLQGSKVIPAGEAGVLCTNNQEIYEKAVALGHYTKINGLESNTYKKYARTGMGIKHRLNPLSAAIGLCQLKKFPEVNARISKNCETFANAIKEIEGTGFIIPKVPKDCKRIFFQNQLIYEEKEGIIPKKDMIFVLRSEGVEVGESRYELLHKQPYFTERGQDPNTMENTLTAVKKLISFPNFPWDENGELVNQYVEAIKKVAHHMKDEF
jgi:perosamine synthetase